MRKALWILLIISVLGNLFLLYLWYESNYANGKSLKVENAELAELLDLANIRADSLQQKLDETLRDYESMINESISLKSERDAAFEELEQNKIQIRQLLYRAKQGDPKALLQARNRIVELEEQLGQSTAEFELLKRSQASLKNQFDSSQMALQQSEVIREEILEDHQDLVEKVKKSKFQVSELKVEPIQEKRNKEVVQYKAGKVDHIRFSFLLEPNELIENGEKVVTIRLLGTNGEVLGAGNDEVLMDSDKLVTMTKTINYTGDPEDLKFKFRQDAEYKKGTYKVEVLSDGLLLTRSVFNLN